MLLGSQVPTYEYRPPAKSREAGRETVELAASAGLLLEPHQSRVLEGALGERADGRWAATTVTVVESRQNGKGGILEARELGGLYLFGERLLTHTAHRYDTSQEHFRRMKPLCVRLSDSTGDRSKKIKRISETNGDESIELMSGQRLIFKARTKLSGRGFSGDFVGLDEAMYLQELGSLIPTMSARPNPQLWFTGSAPLPRVESDPLRRLCREGRRAARGHGKLPRAAYFEWCATVRADPSDFEAWWAEVEAILDDEEALSRALAEANPGLGLRLTREFIETVERPPMTAEEFARERLGLWPDVQATVIEALIPDEDWRACESPESEAVDPVVLAFEVSLDRKWSVIAAAGVSTLGGTHVEVIDNRRGTGWVVARLQELKETHSPAAIVCNPTGPAGGLLADCAAVEMKIAEATAADYAKACEAAYDDIIEHRWHHLGQPELDKAVSGATKRTTGDAWVFDRRAGIDISPLVAVSLAAKVARNPPSPPKPSVYEEREPVVL